MKKKISRIFIVGCLIMFSLLNVMAAEQEYIVDFCDEIRNNYTTEEMAGFSEEINKDISERKNITVVFNDEVLSRYTAEELEEIKKHVYQDVNKHFNERSYVSYNVKAEHDCYPVGPYADVYGGVNYIYNSQNELIAYMQVGVCKYPPARGCSRLVYKYTYI